MRVTMGLAEAIETARRAQGMTQAQLASAAEVTQAALSRYEHGLREPSDEVIERLATALGITAELLHRGGRIRGAMAVDAHMRRRATATARTWRRLEARLNMHRLHSHQLFEEVGLRAERTVPVLDPVEVDSQAAARIARMQWRMPVGPVHGLVQWLESAGCLVIEEDFGTARIDGLSQWIDDHPVILLNAQSPTDRKRLTIAHELGHLVLHSSEFTESPEDDANGFAAEFLMPADVIKPELRMLSLGKLLDLKRVWMVSAQALIERAYRLGTLRSADRTRLYKQLGAKGWRRREPLSDELPPEQPKLSFDIGEALASQGLGVDEIARIAGYEGPSDDNPFLPGRRHLRVL
jgi:Zn-dependent peptidase ImmA (M78 family)/DNA-binding XRE family transcriptional regulator